MGLTKAERYNRNMDKIFAEWRKNCLCVVCGEVHKRTDGGNICDKCSGNIPQ
jgi:hypothetical protein